MRKLVLFIFITLFTIQMFSQQTEVMTRYKDKTRRVYWFDLALRTKQDPETGLMQYYTYPASKVKYATAEDYDKYLWSGISNGSYIAVGPFDTYEQADVSMKLYDPKKAPTDSLLMNNDQNFFYYIINLKKTQRLKSYDFERLPAAVATGNSKDFVKLIETSLMLDRLVIGAFSSQPEAENSKNVFRLEE